MNKKGNRETLAFLLIPVALAAAGTGARGETMNGADETVSELAERGPRIAGMPQRSDVIMRSAQRRPAGRDDPYDAGQAIRGFHATRI